MTTSTRGTTPPPTSPPATSSAARTALGILTAIVLSAVAVTAVAAVAPALGASEDFAPLQPPGYLVAVAVGVLAGAVGWHVVRRRSRRPARLMRSLAPAVVASSLVPDLLLLAGDEPGTNAAGVLSLMAMHLVVAAITLPIFARTAPLPASR